MVIVLSDVDLSLVPRIFCNSYANSNLCYASREIDEVIRASKRKPTPEFKREIYDLLAAYDRLDSTRRHQANFIKAYVELNLVPTGKHPRTSPDDAPYNIISMDASLVPHDVINSIPCHKVLLVPETMELSTTLSDLDYDTILRHQSASPQLEATGRAHMLSLGFDV